MNPPLHAGVSDGLMKMGIFYYAQDNQAATAGTLDMRYIYLRNEKGKKATTPWRLCVSAAATIFASGLFIFSVHVKAQPVYPRWPIENACQMHNPLKM